ILRSVLLPKSDGKGPPDPPLGIGESLASPARGRSEHAQQIGEAVGRGAVDEHVELIGVSPQTFSCIRAEPIRVPWALRCLSAKILLEKFPLAIGRRRDMPHE